MPIKQTIFELIDEKGRTKNQWNSTFDLFIIILILLSIIEIILESFEGLNAQYSLQFRYFEFITVAIFSTEYILRIWTADLKYPHLNKMQARLKFIGSFMGLIDLIAILPFYLPFLLKFDMRFVRILRTVRLLRIFKLNRYTRALKLVGKVFYEKRTELGITIFVTFILLLVSSTIMYHLENEDQPTAFPDIISTFWWAVATLTTVGYGDVFPVTGWGKFISGIIALLGVGLVALPTGIISAGFIEKIEDGKKKEYKEMEYRYCPHCGSELASHQK